MVTQRHALLFVAQPVGACHPQQQWLWAAQQWHRDILIDSQHVTLALVLEVIGQIKAAHILILTMPQPGPDGKPLSPEDQAKKESDAKAKLEGIVADVKAGKTTFEAAAKSFSDDKASAVEGGMLPWFAKNGMMVPEFENAAFALKKPGEISPVVKTQYGYHVIKLVRTGKDATPAEKRKHKDDEVAKLIGSGPRFQQWLAGAVQKATITLDPKALKLKP